MNLKIPLLIFCLCSLNTLAQHTFKDKEAKSLSNVGYVNLPETLKSTIYKNQNATIFVKISEQSSPFKSKTYIDFLTHLKSDLKITEPEKEFKVLNENIQENGIKHIRLQQMLGNIPIYGSESTLHTNSKGEFETISGRIFPSPQLKYVAKISDHKATKAVFKDLHLKKSKITDQKDLSFQLFLKYYQDTPKLIYYIKIKPDVINRWIYFVDANSGQILEKYNETCTIDGNYSTKATDLNGVSQTINTIQSGNKYYLIDATKVMYNSTQSSLPDNPNGTIWTIDGLNSRTNSTAMTFGQLSSTDNTWSANAVSAHFNATTSYDYYLKTFGRNSLNGNGANIISVINITDVNGQSLDNAYWNGEFMGYGNGLIKFKPLAAALDIAGHEMTHGVIENTAKLEYWSQSGAINESMADVFGTMIERKNWTIGEDVVKLSVYPSGALRSLENPNQTGPSDPGYQPMRMSQYKYLQNTDSQDNGGVHINSGIPNYAFYKFADKIGKDKAEKVYYSVLTNYLTRTSTFLDLRYAVIQATKDFYGNADEVKAAKAAFDAAEIYDPNDSNTASGVTSTADTTGILLSPNPGTLSVITFNPTDQSLYTRIVDGTATNPIKITDGLGCLNKPSIMDNGNYMYFVGNDNNIYRIDLINKTKPEKLSADSLWRNVAVSKNGKLIAALKKHVISSKIISDHNIYITNLETNEQKAIKLYNPTYSSGISTGEVLYADSFEWDYSGENVIYDAYNQINSTNGNDIKYWDVGIIRVFDGIKKKILDSAVVQKVFTNLKNGENIGDPSISKTNTNIIAFDYYNPRLDSMLRFKILIWDFNKSKIIDTVANIGLGHPNFSTHDDLLFYDHYFPPTLKDSVKIFGLKSNSWVGIKQSKLMYPNEIWPTPYAIGVRVLPNKRDQYIQLSTTVSPLNSNYIQIYGSATSGLPVIYSLISGDAVLDGSLLVLGTTPGKVTIRVSQIGNSLYNSTSSDYSFCVFPRTPILKDSSDYIVATTGGPIYQFYVNNNIFGNPTTNPILKKYYSGSYTAKSFTNDGCVSPLSNPIGYYILGNEPNDTIVVSPNPFFTSFNISLPANENLRSLKLMSETGNTILENFSSNHNFSQLASGVYLLKIETDKNSYTKKLIKD